MNILDNAKTVHPIEALTPVTDTEELIAMIKAVDEIKVNEAVRGYIADIGIATRTNSNLKLGVSTRGLIALKRMSQARAALRGRDYVTPEDVKIVSPYVCAHRIISRSTVMRDGTDAKIDIVNKLIDDIPVPTENI